MLITCQQREWQCYTWLGMMDFLSRFFKIPEYSNDESRIAAQYERNFLFYSAVASCVTFAPRIKYGNQLESSERSKAPRRIAWMVNQSW